MNARSLVMSWSVVCIVGASAAGCTTRPVVALDQTTKTNFLTDLQDKAVGKIDLLFSIDNSQSMGDKQDYLKKAIPDLITRLLTPNCIDPNATTPSANPPASILDGSGVAHCPAGLELEFPAVADLHIGVVSSSLGPRLSDQTVPGAPGAIPKGPVCDGSGRQDDRGQLVSRTATGATVADAQPSGFLAWYPDVAANAVKAPGAGAPPLKSANQIQTDFEDLVGGIQQDGCGIESQLESWYRFLVQPDPYDHLALDASGRATWVGVDTTILAQRHDFLRPDSLVAVVVLSDENDSEIDVRSYRGLGYWFMNEGYTPARATAICATSPEDPSCLPCADAPNGGAGDPGCATNGGVYSALNDWGMDMNLRHVHMKEKYGADPQFPITRYVTGLTSRKVPDREGEYPPNAQLYVGNNDCTNPLFASALPDGTRTDPASLCNLPPGGRRADEVFFAHIGGVPGTLLHYVPGDPKASALSETDWVQILGKDPLHHDYSGISPYMIESVEPRPGLPPPSAASAPDPVIGREWFTDRGDHARVRVDVQYACTFPIPPRDCTNPAFTAECDCTDPSTAPEDLSPVCDPVTVTRQLKAKSYPTPRELLVAKLMDRQGVVSSICPIHPTEQGTGDPLYGYRPAVSAIVERLKTALTKRCLPDKLTLDAQGKAPCLVLATLPTAGGESACDPKLGLSPPDPDVLATFRKQAEATWASGGGKAAGEADPGTLPVCEVTQLAGGDLVAGSCKTSQKPGWCYVSGADGCSQEVLFSPSTLPSDARVSLECINVTTTR